MATYSIKELRRLLLHEPVFADVKDYFFDWFEEHHEIAFKTETMNDVLKEMVTHGLTEVYKKEIVYNHLEMREVQSLCLLHGAGEAKGDIMVTFFYFTDLDLGMFATMRMDSDREILARFQMLGPEKLTFDTSGRMN
jgi:hypothetical protein